MEQREIAAIARGVKRRRCFGDVLAHDRGVADLAIAEGELVVGQTDGFGIVGLLGVTKRSSEQRDRARLVPFRERDSPMKPPKRGKQSGREIFARRVGRASESGRRLRDVIAHQPRFGECASQTDLILVFEPGGFQRLGEHGDRIGVTATLQCRSRARQRRLKGDGDHRREYTTVR